MTVDGMQRQYENERFSHLQLLAGNIESYLNKILVAVPRVDSVRARAKSPESFAAKAVKLNSDGSQKYDHPFSQIQDQLGARITVFYLSDIERIRKIVVESLRFIESQEKRPESDNAFGYFGTHYIMRVPDDAVPEELESTGLPDFFELQIKTLFQHAWSEAHHDLGYKSIRDLQSDEVRKVAYSSAQAWGADQIFEELSSALSNDNEPKKES